VLLVPWEARVEPDEQVRDLAERIVHHDGPGVLRWAVEGARRWRDEGGLLVPEDVKIKTRQYRIREDTIGEFIEECMVKADGAMASTTDVWSAYEIWCAK
jgi:phage/plasmid-associated DNA primase